MRRMHSSMNYGSIDQASASHACMQPMQRPEQPGATTAPSRREQSKYLTSSSINLMQPHALSKLVDWARVLSSSWLCIWVFLVTPPTIGVPSRASCVKKDHITVAWHHAQNTHNNCDPPSHPDVGIVQKGTLLSVANPNVIGRDVKNAFSGFVMDDVRRTCHLSSRPSQCCFPPKYLPRVGNKQQVTVGKFL